MFKGKKGVWSPVGTDAASVANNRVCLVLLRIHRMVPLAMSELDRDEFMRLLWPLVVMEQAHFTRAMRAAPGIRRRRKVRGPDLEPTFAERPEWLTQVLDEGAALPDRPPGGELLTEMTEELLMDTPRFRPLFDAIEKRLERLTARNPAPSDQNVELLAQLLKMNPSERAIMLLCAAVETSYAGGSIFGQVQRKSLQIEALQAGLLLDDAHEVRAALSATSQLVRGGILPREVVDMAYLRDLDDILRMTRQGSALLTAGVKGTDDMAAAVLQPLVAARGGPQLEWPHLASRGDSLKQMLARALARREPGINILLYGAPGTGKTEFAAQLISAVGVQGYNIRSMDEFEIAASRNERLASLFLSQFFAPAGRSVLVLDEAEDIFQNDYNSPLARVFGKQEGSKAWMNGVLEGNAHPVIWISNQVVHIDPAYLRRFSYCLEFPTTPRGVRRKIAQTHLEPLGCSPDLVNSVASHAQVTPALLASAARFAGLVEAKGPAADTAVRFMLTDSLKAMGTDVAGTVPARSTRFDLHYLNVKGQVQPGAVLAGLQRMGQGTLLLSGAPGTGKTQLAAEIAHLLGRELVYKTASDINTMWFGESERNVARMFTECDPASEVLFLDEADTLLASREADGHRANVAVAAEFLRRVEAFDGVFVCATNHRARLDAALMRRFAFRLELLPLTAQQRRQLLCETALEWSCASGLPLPGLDAPTVASLDRLDQLTPGDFANVVKRIRALGLTLNAAQWVEELAMEHGAKPDLARSSIGFV